MTFKFTCREHQVVGDATINRLGNESESIFAITFESPKWTTGIAHIPELPKNEVDDIMNEIHGHDWAKIVFKEIQEDYLAMMEFQPEPIEVFKADSKNIVWLQLPEYKK